MKKKLCVTQARPCQVLEVLVVFFCSPVAAGHVMRTWPEDAWSPVKVESHSLILCPPGEGMTSVKQLGECRERLRRELDGVVDFWLRYSHDSVHG